MKFSAVHNFELHHVSLPVRGAWIEIKPEEPAAEGVRVAPRAGSVD